jgi:hypothetical protein
LVVANASVVPLELLKLRKHLGNRITHSLGSASANRKSFSYLVEAYARRLGGE